MVEIAATVTYARITPPRQGLVDISNSNDGYSCQATANQEDRVIVRLAATELDSSLSTIRRKTRTGVSTMNIHRRLIERNVSSYRPLLHLPFTRANCLDRLQTVWNHADRDLQIRLCSNDNRRSVWRWFRFPIARHACHIFHLF
ncbi:hypothetical protein TNCV_3853801 [Trichonephila clavipes]|nr:hypothetical protein TNCV_3853801 [Trichonephila clavipes]